MIRFTCPKCDATYSAAEEHAGKRTTCKQCGEKFLIPGGEEPPPLPYDIETFAVPPNPPPIPEPERSFLAPPAPEASPPDLSVPVELQPCPQCQAKMSVRPDDVGYDIQCPFCQTVFRGVAATGKPALSAPEPAPEPEGIEIAPCPKCRAELTVSPDDLGGEVECPFCQTVYKAEKPKPKANTLLARPSKAPPPPPKKASVIDDEDAPVKPIRMKVEVEDDDDDYRPRKKKKKKRKYYDNDPYAPYDERILMTEPSNGIACLMMGLFAFFCCAIVAFWSIPQCNETISKVNAGQMDSSAKPLAITGLVLSYIAIVLWILNIIGICAGGLMGGRR